jgi:hypothetical protein
MLWGLGAWATLPAVIGGYIGNPHNRSMTCEQGNNAWIYMLLWFFVPGWFSFVCQVTALTIVYRKVLRQERMNERFVFADHNV